LVRRHITLVYPCSEDARAGLVETFEISDAHASQVNVFALDMQALVCGAALPAGLGPGPVA
jgi:hypothetical protein